MTSMINTLTHQAALRKPQQPKQTSHTLYSTTAFYTHLSDNTPHYYNTQHYNTPYDNTPHTTPLHYTYLPFALPPIPAAPPPVTPPQPQHRHPPTPEPRHLCQSTPISLPLSSSLRGPRHLHTSSLRGAERPERGGRGE